MAHKSNSGNRSNKRGHRPRSRLPIVSDAHARLSLQLITDLRHGRPADESEMAMVLIALIAEERARIVTNVA